VQTLVPAVAAIVSLVRYRTSQHSQVTEPETTDRIIRQGQAIVRALEALEIIEPTGSIEAAITWLLLQAHRRRLRAIVGLAPAWVV
jgi:hypothetical protein